MKIFITFAYKLFSLKHKIQKNLLYNIEIKKSKNLGFFYFDLEKISCTKFGVNLPYYVPNTLYFFLNFFFCSISKFDTGIVFSLGKKH